MITYEPILTDPQAVTYGITSDDPIIIDKTVLNYDKTPGGLTQLVIKVDTSTATVDTADGGKKAKTPIAYAPRSLDSIIDYYARQYLAECSLHIYDLYESDTLLYQLRDDILDAINVGIECHNATVDAKSKQFTTLKSIPGSVAAKIVLSTGDVRAIAGGGLAAKHYYKDGGEYLWGGTYEEINFQAEGGCVLTHVYNVLCPNTDSNGNFTNFKRALHNAPTARICGNNKLVWLRNGLWDYNKREFVPYNNPDFDRLYPDTITLSKLPIFHPYGDGATLIPDEDGRLAEPCIIQPNGEPWYPSSVFSAPFYMDTPEGIASNTILWQAAQFLIRHVNGGSTPMFHLWVNADGIGGNGKGCALDFMLGLVDNSKLIGEPDMTFSGETTITASLEELSDTTSMAPNIRTAYAITNGESDQGSNGYVEKSAAFKSLGRAEKIHYKPKYHDSFDFAFNGLCCQHLNQIPRFKEKNTSVLRAVVIIPFARHFVGEGLPDTSYIKRDYIHRIEVLEWVIYHLTVEMDCLEQYDTDALDTLEPLKHGVMKASMNTVQFLDEVIPGLNMDFIPLELLYDLYLRYCESTGQRFEVDMKSLREDLRQYATNNEFGMQYVDAGTSKRNSASDTGVYHPAIADYGYSRKLGTSKYVDDTYDHQVHHLNEATMTMKDGNGGRVGKIWNRGGLIRTTTWKDDTRMTVNKDKDKD